MILQDCTWQKFALTNSILEVQKPGNMNLVQLGI